MNIVEDTTERFVERGHFLCGQVRPEGDDEGDEAAESDCVKCGGLYKVTSGNIPMGLCFLHPRIM